MSNYFIGTCSWTDRTLISEVNFYPPTVKTPTQRLQFYASIFNTVEVDSSFYTFIAEQNAQKWAERTPAQFLFNYKAFSLFTFHFTTRKNLPSFLLAELPPSWQWKDSLNARDLPQEFLRLGLQAFLSSLQPLQKAQKIGYLLFQFPPWFEKRADNVSYLEWLQEEIGDFPVAIEFRHRSWLKPEERKDTLTLLKRLRFAYVCVDEPQLPWTVPPVVAHTVPFLVVRFHGRNAVSWQKKKASVWERFNYLYGEEELQKWANIIKSQKEVERIFLLFNNCFRNYAVCNAQMMQKLLTQKNLE
ncbi:MAG: DUF72 domain-containing protein [Candidatus Caldatribacteriaceae bacterium]